MRRTPRPEAIREAVELRFENRVQEIVHHRPLNDFVLPRRYRAAVFPRPAWLSSTRLRASPGTLPAARGRAVEQPSWQPDPRTRATSLRPRRSRIPLEREIRCLQRQGRVMWCRGARSASLPASAPLLPTGDTAPRLVASGRGRCGGFRMLILGPFAPAPRRSPLAAPSVLRVIHHQLRNRLMRSRRTTRRDGAALPGPDAGRLCGVSSSTPRSPATKLAL